MQTGELNWSRNSDGFRPKGVVQTRTRIEVGEIILKKLLSAFLAVLGVTSADSDAQLFGPDIPEQSVAVAAIGSEIDSFMAHDLGHGSFLVLLLREKGPDGYPGFAQISFENGKLGVDHVLNCDMNTSTESKFRDLVSEMGLRAREVKMNGTRYLRVETRTPTELVTRVLTEVFSLSDDSQVTVFGELESNN